MEETKARIDGTHGGRFDKFEGKKPSLFSNYCKKNSGHSIDTCYKIRGFPQNYKFKGGRRTAALAHANDQGTLSSISKFIYHEPQNNITILGLTQEESS